MDLLSIVKEKNMHKQFAKLMLILALSITLLISQVGSISAQGLPPTPTPAAGAIDLLAGVPVTDPNVITFEMLKRNEIQLVGPYDSNGFSFFIPADWKLNSGAQMQLSMGISFNTLVQNVNDTIVRSGGTLTVRISNQVVTVIPLNEIGETLFTFSIPPDLLIPTNPNQTIDVNFILNSGIACNLDQNTNIFIHTTSRFILPHDQIEPDTNLVNFPRPIFQNNILTDSALVVVGDKPSAAELQAALTVSSGLANLSGNSLVQDLTTIGKLTEDQKKVNHIVFVGKGASLSSVKELTLPVPITNNQFEITDGKPDDGLIQMVNSPWSNSHVVLVVSGNSDAGIIKAAQAVSTGVIQPNKSPNFAVIEKVDMTAASSSQAETRTLAELGYKNVVVQGRGVNFNTYIFNIPPGFTLSTDAYFDLVYGNSALLNYNRSGIVLQLNNRPIGSVKFSDATTGMAMNTAHILIPAAAILPGRNVLQIVTTLWPTDDCTPPNVNQGFFVNIWPDSILHLPLIPSAVTPFSNEKSLDTYLPAFINNPLLSDTAFVVSSNDPDSWRSAAQIASYLGSSANGTSTGLVVFFGDAVPATEGSKYNFLVVGRPSQMTFMSGINSKLPAPFQEKSDTAVTDNFRVTYRVPTESPLGYLEILPSQWNPNNVILTVLGNSTQGVEWATAALINTNLNFRLAGNFAVVNGTQILTTDTRLVVAAPQAGATQALGETAALPAGNPTRPQQVIAPSTDWVLPALIASLILIVLILAIIMIGSWSRNRTRRKSS
jgi:cellulose synthase operon protein B